MCGSSLRIEPMAAYAVRIERVPAESDLEPGTIVALFEDRESAEYFRSVAWNLRSLRGCWLGVVMFPALDRPHAKARAA